MYKAVCDCGYESELYEELNIACNMEGEKCECCGEDLDIIEVDALS